MALITHNGYTDSRYMLVTCEDGTDCIKVSQFVFCFFALCNLVFLQLD